MNQSSRDPYATLGVAPSASRKEIRKRYRRLCKQFHPDLNQGHPQSADIFKEVKWAYDEILSGMSQQSDCQDNSVAFQGREQGCDSAHPFLSFFGALRAYCSRMNSKEEP